MNIFNKGLFSKENIVLKNNLRDSVLLSITIIVFFCCSPYWKNLCGILPRTPHGILCGTSYGSLHRFSWGLRTGNPCIDPRIGSYRRHLCRNLCSGFHDYMGSYIRTCMGNLDLSLSENPMGTHTCSHMASHLGSHMVSCTASHMISYMGIYMVSCTKSYMVSRVGSGIVARTNFYLVVCMRNNMMFHMGSYIMSFTRSYMVSRVWYWSLHRWTLTKIEKKIWSWKNFQRCKFSIISRVDFYVLSYTR